MVIIETPIFTKQVLAALSEDEYRHFQSMLLERPDAGKVMPGSGGLRKVRWAAEGRGKRGGIRVIYYWFTVQGKYSSEFNNIYQEAGPQNFFLPGICFERTENFRSDIRFPGIEQKSPATLFQRQFPV